MILPRNVISGLIVGVVLAATPSAVMAQPDVSSGGGQVEASVVYAAPTGTRVQAGSANTNGVRWACGWYPLGDTANGVEPATIASAPIDDQLYMFACWADIRPDAADWATTVFAEPRRYEPAEPTPDPGPVDVDDIVDAIFDRRILDPTPVEVELNPSGDQVVHVDTWLHVADDWNYEPVTAHAGPVEVTVSIRPIGFVFDPADGNPPMVCASRGERYDPEQPADRQDTDCSYTYRRASVEPYPATGTVSWAVRYDSNVDGGRDLAPISEVTPIPMTVRELQAVID